MQIRGSARLELSLIAAVLAPAIAEAHHPVQDQGVGHAQPRTFAAADVEAAGFELAEQRGDYYTLRLRGEYTLVPYFSVGLAAPFHLLKLQDRSLRSGPGDVDVLARLRVVNAERHAWFMSVGLGVELPTGDTDAGLGAGHVELTPFVSTMKSLGPLMVHGTLALNASLAHSEAGHDHEAEPVFVNPHSSLELVYHAGALYPVSEGLYLNGVAAANTVLEAAERWETFLVLRPEVGFMPADDWRISMVGHLPVAGERRFDWKATATLVRTF